MIEAGLSELVTYTPAGSEPRWLGSIGHVQDLVYSWVNPGGANQLTATLQTPADLRTDALDPGRQLKVKRGGRTVWDGKMLEPTYTPGTGWQITGAGVGAAAQDFVAYYTAPWGSSANDAVNQAITRGLRWVNPGISPGVVWFGQVVDNASIMIGDLLNLFCTKGSLTWYVATADRENVLSVYAFPQQPTPAQANRVLVAASPQSRTLGGDINALYGRYQTSADSATSATYGTAVVTNAADITAHGRVEAFDDLSSAGQETVGTIDAALQSVLNRYQRASWAGPFTVHYGEFLNAGGTPQDLGTDQCSTIVRLVLADTGYGGEVVPEPVVFLTGAYQWDEHNQQGQVTPFQSLDLSMTGLLYTLQTVLGGLGFTLKQEQAAWAPGRPASERGFLYINGQWVAVPRPPSVGK